jgi:hypothetical protein
MLAGLVLRLHGIRNGLPFLYDVDEPDFVSLSVHMLRAEHLNPHWWGHPGTTFLYMLEVIYGAMYFIGHALKVFADPAAFQALYLRDPTVFYLSGRYLCTLFGVASIALVFAIGRRLMSDAAALFAAALLALSPLHVDVSRLVRTDIIATFFHLCALWFLIGAVQRRDAVRLYLLAGFATGLATATKYPTVLFVLVIAAAALGMPAGMASRLKRAGIGALGTAAGLIVGSPLLLLSVREVIGDLHYENRASNLGLTGFGFFGNLAGYVLHVLPATLTWPGLVLAAAGGVWCLRSPRRELRLIPLFPLILVVFFSGLHLFRATWLIPALPCCALAAAFALQEAWGWLSRRGRTAAASVGVAAVAAVVLFQLARVDVVHSNELAGVETRTIAARWIVEHVSPNSRLLEEQTGPQLPTGRFAYYDVSRGGSIEPQSPTTRRYGYFRPNQNWDNLDLGYFHAYDQLRTAHIDYVVMSQRKAYEAAGSGYEDVVRSYAALAALGERVFTVAPERGVRGGPDIEVYRLRN